MRASGVSPGETRIRSGELREAMPTTFPYRTGFDAAGVVAIVGDPARVVTIADVTAPEHGVHLSYGAPTSDPDATLVAADPLAVHGLAIAVALADEGRLRMPVAAVFPFTEAAAAHELSETRHARGKIVLVS
ncbi:zinc-binding dehydrogenase [Compostimonas suwonensis]|uniref:zinc-binding dehydrogenase n=1 Tax=Compostimonas suwonensis TaxID=1048394 RepID=UPI001FE84D31|nr:zinc-binding dehydrogenase [Compostimonas suwonensis]